MNEELSKLYDDLQSSDTQKGKQARHNLGLIFYFRIQQLMAEGDDFMMRGDIRVLPYAFSRFDSCFRKIRGLLKEDELKKLEEIRNKCKNDVFTLKVRERNMSRNNYEGNRTLFAPKTLIPLLEDYDMALNDSLNNHNLNIPIRGDTNTSMSTE